MQHSFFQQIINPCYGANGYVKPCYQCCTPSRPSTRRTLGRHHGTRATTECGFQVKLAVSPLGRLGGVAGFHTSVIVGGRELFFGNCGISSFHSCFSHQNNPDLQVIDMGISRYSHLDVARILRKHFLPGTYDILLKNCNSFTDCALYMMCEQRLAWHFRGLDTIGRTVDANGLLRSLLPDRYRPNPLCADWQLEDVIGQIDSEFPFPLGVITADEVDDGYVVCDIDDEGSGSVACGRCRSNRPSLHSGRGTHSLPGIGYSLIATDEADERADNTQVVADTNASNGMVGTAGARDMLEVQDDSSDCDVIPV